MSDTADKPDVMHDTRRDFLYLATATMAVAGTAAAIWPFLDSMNPAADVRALASVEVDLAPVVVGQSITVKWRGKPIFIRHRTAQEIATARKDDGAVLPDPEPDSARAQKSEWLILVGICPHLGCVPLGQKPGEPRGEYGGWFCPCHGSQFDTSGRIRKGPSPTNLPLPEYNFIGDTMIRIG